MEIKDRLRSIKVTHECYVETVWYVDVTDYAVKIFGDIIKKAEVTLYYDENDIKEAQKEAKDYINSVEEDNRGIGKINFDAENMLITFVNGKQVELWNSEWGGIRTPINNEI